MKHITAFIICISALGVGHAQVYKHVDERGRTQYSDIPVGSTSKAVQDRISTVVVCDAECRKRIAYDAAERSMPANECAVKFYPASKKSKQLANQAREECRRNYAMTRADPNFRPSTAATERNAAHNDAIAENLSRVRSQGPNQMTLQSRGRSVNCQNVGGGTYNCY